MGLSVDFVVQKLRRIIVEDELGICEDLERDMHELVGTYYDEWKAVVDDPARQKQFRQFVNTVRRMTSVFVLLFADLDPSRRS